MENQKAVLTKRLKRFKRSRDLKRKSLWVQMECLSNYTKM
jgi:hypothetical protein